MIERVGTYSVNKILRVLKHYSKIKNKSKTVLFEGYLIKPYSLRYKTFMKSISCVECGMKASYFALERYTGAKSYHFNLYGKKRGKEILFTKDHIKPKAKGGTNAIDNLQTMCSKCNFRKADNYEAS